MNRGRRREQIFLDKKDYEAYLELLGKCFEFFELEIHAYSLMPNHYHLLVRTPRGNLSRAMRHLDGVWTQKYNRKYGHDGALFRGRYKAILVGGDSYLMELVRYIHRNPLEAGLESGLGKHPWTSHRAYLGKKDRPAWLQRDHVLKYFGKREKEALRRMDAFVKKQVPKELEKRLSGENWPAMLGGARFKEWVKEKYLGKRLDETGVPQLRAIIRDCRISNLKKAAEKLWGIAVDEWKKARRGKMDLRRRAMIYASRKLMKAGGREIGEEFGRIGFAAVSMQCRKAEADIRKGRGCAKAFSELEKATCSQMKS